MKTPKKPIACILLAGLWLLPILEGASTPGSVTLTATINDLTAKSGSNHDAVVWVTNSSGTFIKTLWKQGASTFSATGGDWDHFSTWNTARNGSSAFDGFTSATATSYSSPNNPVSVTWNCKDASNAIVPDGVYYFYIQYAENISSPKNGPVTGALAWTKGTSPGSTNPANEGTLDTPSGGYNFTNMSIVWTPALPEIAVEQPAGTNLTDGNATLSCGNIMIGSVSPAFTFTVRNTGTATLNLTNPITKTGPHANDFNLSGIATTVAAGSSTTFTITFSPSAPGLRTGTIQIYNDDANENPFDIQLSGTGTTAFEAWGTQMGLPAGQSSANDIPQGDGITNLAKFAFNLTPLIPDCRSLTPNGNETAGLPCASQVGGKLRLEFLRRKASSNPGITYTPQFSSLLGSWSDFSGSPVSVVSVSTMWERVKVDDPNPGSGSRFGRIVVTQP